jgi:DNA-binding transcriptional LysR family regulator
MELRDLRYFVAVASELHFARAAQRLFISQPALSQQIRSLEAELGLRLLDRNSRSVHLTREGETFLREANILVRDADRATEVARALAEGAAGHLRLSHLRTMPGGVPERILSEYQQRYPGVEVIPESGSTEQNLDRVRTGQLDAAFVLAPIEESAELGCIEVATEPIVVAIPSAHALRRRRRIRREDLVGIPLVWYPRHNSPGFYDSSLSQIYGDISPEIVRTEPNEERMLIAVSQGLGITMLLAGRTATLRFPAVVYRRFAEPEPTGVIALVFHVPASLAARRFVDLAASLV